MSLDPPAPPVESIDRALLVLLAVTEAGSGGASLARLAERVGVNKTTLHRALGALRFRDFVEQDPDSGHYRLGAAALTLGDGYLGEENLAAALHPALVGLSAEVDELVHLGVLAGSQIVYLDKVEPDRPVRVWSAVGRRMPAASTALGRAMLLDRVSSPAALLPYLPAADGDGEGTADVVARTWAVLEDGRRTGYAYEREENEPGIACVAVALQRRGATVAAVSVTAPRERMTDARLVEVGEAIRTLLPPLLPPGIGVRPISPQPPPQPSPLTR